MFAIVFSLAFLIAAWFDVRLYWTLFVAAGFLSGAFLCPWLLRPLNSLWREFAQALGAFNNCVILGMFYFVCVTPYAVVMRAFGRDMIPRRPDDRVETYWSPVTRQADPATYADQF